MKNKSILILSLSVIIFLFSACSSIKNDLSAKTNKALITVDESTYNLETNYEKTKFTVKKSYEEVSNSIANLKSSFYENSFIQLFVPDETILEKRKELVIWEKGTTYGPQWILNQYLKKNNSNVDAKGLSLSQKIKILNEYFNNKEQKIYINKFSKKYPKPKVDEFLTDRENINAINKYKLQLTLAKNQWKLQENNIQKKVMAKTLSRLYGKPKIKNITYDPENEELYLNIVSSRDKFSQKVYFEVEKDTAKKMKKYSYYLKPTLYFSLNNKQLNLIGASIKYKDENYLAKFTDEMYNRNQNIKLTANGLDLSSVDVDYKIVSKNITPPNWFYKLPNNGKIIGYGMGDSEQEAKNSAYREIVQQLEVKVSSEINTDKRSDGSNFSSRTKQNVNVKTKDIKLVGTKTIKSEKKNSIWFIAVSK